MNRSISLVALLLFAFQFCTAQNKPDFRLHDIRVDLVYLSSDYLEGRQPGTQGEALAAEYISGRFAALGLQPKGEFGSWYQGFTFQEQVNPHDTVASGPAKTGKNVVGYIDNGAANTVIIGAHYDHLGYGEKNSLFVGEKAIHNGADDNASGTSALIALAGYLKQSKARKNNYLFIAFSAEESGLVGSKYFAANPTIDLSKVNYMLNMDMVGRLKEEKVLAIGGAGTSPVWKKVLPAIQVDGITLSTTDSGIGPSDHTSFYLKDIPVLHFFTGQHQQYHKPADDAGLINFEGLLSVGRFIAELVEKLDGEPKLAFTKTKDESQRAAAGFKVTLGVMPDYVYTGKGMRIDAVLEDRPAKAAGLLGGDVLIKLGSVDIPDIYAYMEALGKFKKGEKAIAVVKRGEQTVEAEVTF